MSMQQLTTCLIAIIAEYADACPQCLCSNGKCQCYNWYLSKFYLDGPKDLISIIYGYERMKPRCQGCAYIYCKCVRNEVLHAIAKMPLNIRGAIVEYSFSWRSVANYRCVLCFNTPVQCSCLDDISAVAHELYEFYGKDNIILTLNFLFDPYIIKKLFNTSPFYYWTNQLEDYILPESVLNANEITGKIFIEKKK